MAEFDIEKLHPTGAHEPVEDHRDYQWDMDEIAQAAVPFDWSKGYDVEADLGIKLTVKNQGTSGSCGGQAISALGQVLCASLGKGSEERSAKFPYAQVFVPGGGSDYRSLANIYIKQGIGREADCPSYNNGAAPDEEFMERVHDITAAARTNAALDEISLAYAFPATNIDTVAQAVAACKGAILLLHGSNNGTWLSEQPKPTSYRPEGVSNTVWTHYIYAGKPMMHNGKKGIWCLNSWGVGAGNAGWQFLDEEYFSSGDILGAIVIFYNPKPTGVPQHIFNVNLKEGDRGSEVTALQTLLAYDGCFNLAPTGFYGPITAQAVLKFQKKYQVDSDTNLEDMMGYLVGPKTRAALNSLVK